MNGLVQFLGDGLDPDGSITERLIAMGIEVGEFDSKRSLAQQIGEADVVLLRDGPLGETEFDAAKHLKLVQRTGVHVYGVDLAAAARRGVVIGYVPSEFNPGLPVAEHALFLMLALAKKWRPSQRSIIERRVSTPPTMLLSGKTLGLVGVGRIGSEMIGIARAIGMDVVGIRRTTYPGMQDALRMHWLGAPEDLLEMLSMSDIVSLHLPGGVETNDSIGPVELAAMKSEGLLINTARASLVNYDALYDVLANNKLGGYAADVWWQEPLDPNDPLLSFDNVIATPHTGAFARGARLGVVEVVAENVRRALIGEKIEYQVTVDE